MRHLAASFVVVLSFGCEGEKSYLGAGATGGGSGEGGALSVARTEADNPGAEGGRHQSSGATAGEDSVHHTGGRATAVAGTAGDEPTAGRSHGAAGARGALVDGTSAGTAGRDDGNPEGGAGGIIDEGYPSPTGGRFSVSGGAGGTAGVPALPYPLEPTLPLNPDCTCASSDEVCDAADQCVPRCDDAGRCAAWLVTGPVQSLYAEGDTLYFTTLPETDALGNPVTLGILWRVEGSEATPERVSNAVGSTDDLPNYLEIIGRHAGSTYVRTGWEQEIYEVTDAGAVRALATPTEEFSDAVVTSNGVFCANGSRLWRIRYDADAVPELLIESAQEGSLAADNRVWYATDSALYVFDPESTPEEASSSMVATSSFQGGDLVGVEGDVTFVAGQGDTWVDSHDDTGQRRLMVFEGTDVMNSGYELARSWLYAWCSYKSHEIALVRAPTTVGRLPQTVLPHEIAAPASEVPGGYTYPVWTVGDSHVFWTRADSDIQLHYIFRAPLPAQPCDEGLPCQKDDEQCGDEGLCVN